LRPRFEPDAPHWIHVKSFLSEATCAVLCVYVHMLTKSFVQLVKSRRMRWSWHVARTGEEVKHKQGFGGEIWKKDFLEDQGVDGNALLKWILSKQEERAWELLIWLMIGLMTGCCEHGNELSVSIIREEFTNCQLPKTNSVAWSYLPI